MQEGGSRPRLSTRRAGPPLVRALVTTACTRATETTSPISTYVNLPARAILLPCIYNSTILMALNFLVVLTRLSCNLLQYTLLVKLVTTYTLCPTTLSKSKSTLRHWSLLFLRSASWLTSMNKHPVRNEFDPVFGTHYLHVAHPFPL